MWFLIWFLWASRGLKVKCTRLLVNWFQINQLRIYVIFLGCDINFVVTFSNHMIVLIVDWPLTPVSLKIIGSEWHSRRRQVHGLQVLRIVYPHWLVKIILIFIIVLTQIIVNIVILLNVNLTCFIVSKNWSGGRARQTIVKTMFAKTGQTVFLTC